MSKGGKRQSNGRASEPGPHQAGLGGSSDWGQQDLLHGVAMERRASKQKWVDSPTELRECAPGDIVAIYPSGEARAEGCQEQPSRVKVSGNAPAGDMYVRDVIGRKLGELYCLSGYRPCKLIRRTQGKTSDG